MEGSQYRLYIGNLEYSTTEDDIRQAFADKGVTLQDVRVIKDKYSGRSKGFGFAEVDSEDTIQAAITAMDGQDLKGRNLRVNKAEERKPRRDNFNSGGPGGPGGSSSRRFDRRF